MEHSWLKPCKEGGGGVYEESSSSDVTVQYNTYKKHCTVARYIARRVDTCSRYAWGAMAIWVDGTG